MSYSDEDKELDRQYEACNPEFDRDAIKASIKTWPDSYEHAPADCRWHATVGDYDLDCEVGSGATPEEAIENLLDQLEDEWDNSPENPMARLRVLLEKDD